LFLLLLFFLLDLLECLLMMLFLLLLLSLLLLVLVVVVLVVLLLLLLLLPQRGKVPLEGQYPVLETARPTIKLVVPTRKASDPLLQTCVARH